MNFFFTKGGSSLRGNFKRKHWVIVFIFTFFVVAIVAWFAHFADKQVQKMRDITREHMIPEPFRLTEAELKGQDNGQENDQALFVQRQRAPAGGTCH